jgi:hypothetical protein
VGVVDDGGIEDDFLLLVEESLPEEPELSVVVDAADVEPVEARRDDVTSEAAKLSSLDVGLSI